MDVLSIYEESSGIPEEARAHGPAAPDEVMFSLLAAAHSVEQRMETAMEEVGLSTAKFSALTHLVEAGEALSLSECASA